MDRWVQNLFVVECVRARGLELGRCRIIESLNYVLSLATYSKRWLSEREKLDLRGLQRLALTRNFSLIFNFSKYCYLVCKHTQVLFLLTVSFKVSERHSKFAEYVQVVNDYVDTYFLQKRKTSLNRFACSYLSQVELFDNKKSP